MAPDIRKKLQKLEGFKGENLSKRLEIAQKVFNNREDVQKVMFVGQDKSQGLPGRDQSQGPSQHPKRKADQGRRYLEKDQCAYCKKKRHWKSMCPERGQGSGKKAPLIMFEDAE